MYLYFNDFRYINEKQLLYKAGKLIPLKRNQATLLFFFLSDTESIHSKDDILSAVWGTQVVSEQVVFQTISQLRAILGSEAIKTFPRKGYKWEIDVSTASKSNQTDTAAFKPIISTNQSDTGKTSLNKNWLLFCLLLIFVLSLYFTQQIDRENGLIKLNFLSSPHQQTSSLIRNAVERTFSQSTRLNLEYIEKSISVSQAFSSPNLAFKQADLPEDEWLFWGNVYSSDEFILLHYGLSGKMMHWQGFIQVDSNEQLSKALSSRLEQLLKLGLFDSNLKGWDINSVKSLLNKWPEDPDLLLLAAKKHQYMDQNDVAMSYLRRIVEEDSLEESSPYKAIAHWKIGKIYKMRGHHEQAHNSLVSMSKILKQLPLGPLHFQYIKTNAWLAYSETDHKSMHETLEKGFSYFDGSNTEQPLIKFKLHILNSILAQKTSNNEMKYHHLSQAQALLLEHKLDESNYAFVYYHHALFSQLGERNMASKGGSSSLNTFVVFLKRILKLPRTTDNFWVHDEAIELLVNHYIESEDYVSANAVLIGRSDTPKRYFLKAKILLSAHHNGEALNLFERAFQQAKIDYDSRTAIESALKLYQLSESFPKRQAEYLAYLESNAQDSWLKEKLIIANRRTH